MQLNILIIVAMFDWMMRMVAVGTFLMVLVIEPVSGNQHAASK